MKFLSKRWVRVLLSGLLLSLVFLVFAFLSFSEEGFFHQIESKTYDFRLRLKTKSLSLGQPADVVIADIDEKSLKVYGRWPWSRTVMAELIDKLSSIPVRAMGFDLTFSEEVPDPSVATLEKLRSLVSDKSFYHDLDPVLNDLTTDNSPDQQLARSLLTKTPITLGFFFNIETGPESISRAGICSDTPQLLPYPPQFSGLVANLEIFSLPHLGYGSFNFFPDADGVARSSYFALRFGDAFYPNLALATLAKALGKEPKCLADTSGFRGIEIGDYFIPTDIRSKSEIHYYGSHRPFSYFSIADILQDKIPRSLLENKIVLIGSSAPGIYDLRVTPLSKATPGVELHATMIQNILDRLHIHRGTQERFLDLVFLFGLGLLCFIVLPRLNAWQGAAFALVLVGGFALFDWFYFFQRGSWQHLFFPILEIFLLYAGISLVNFLRTEAQAKSERKKRAAIKAAFQQYVSKSLVEEISKRPEILKLGGERRELTVLFSDIRGFTTISERLTPEALVDLLNEYLTPMTDIVLSEQGMLDKYMGDAIMAVFGAPLPLKKHAHFACRAALLMVDELTKLQKAWAERSIPPLHMGLGINTGEMAIGNMGSKQRFDYTVMGDHVNLASRLEGVNKYYGTTIIASQFTKMFTDDEFVFRELDLLQVKGKTQSVAIYELMGDRKSASSFLLEVASRFESALILYRKMAWQDSLKQFEELLAFHPEDGPTKTFIERIRYFIQNPPPADWNGSFRMETK